MKLRENNIQRLKDEIFDVLIVGGGINGAVAAASLSGQGVRVALIDRGDFASFTSQASANLIWGGMKYMEGFEYGLVRKLCNSRNHLMRSYPSTVKEMRFLTVMEKGFRFPPALMVFGAYLYWFIGSFFTRRPEYVSRAGVARQESRVNVDLSSGGFESSEAYLHDNDARFVFQFVRRSLDNGAAAANYIEATGSRSEKDLCVTKVREQKSGKTWNIRSRTFINAAGPFADEFNRRCGIQTRARHIFSKGIHLIVDRITDTDKGLVFFASDGRPFYVVPMGPRSCIGTTDTPLTQLPPRVEPEDRRFILDNINRRMRFSPPLREKNIIAERCGVRPLVVENEADARKDWTALSRKHVIEVDQARKFITIFGGKMTDCLNVGAEIASAVGRLGVALPAAGRRWYGDPSLEVRAEFNFQAARMDLDRLTAPESSEPLSARLWRRYGLSALPMLEMIRHDPAMARVVEKGVEYIRCELYHAAEHEMIETLEDFLRRRSKIALIASRETIRKSKGVREACQVLFGKQATAKFNEYFK